MKLARFWARASQDGAVARGWSDESLEQAREAARRTARLIADKLASGNFEKAQYLYGDRPLPEPIIQQFADDSGGAPRAIVTRNVYGSLVLNTRNLMFVDIDSDAASTPAAIEREARGGGLAARVYKTAAGYRAILTSSYFEAGDATSEAWLRQFGADPLYTRLCRLQQSFRARLSPKPWRCNLGMPPVSFPFDTPDAEGRFYAWVRNYNARTQGYATCRFLGEVGGAAHPSFADLIEYHDQETKAGSSMPLA
jgi:hypothetical protein